MELAAGCEERLAGFLGAPASTLTAVAFILVGLAILAGRPATVRSRFPYGLLVAAVGVGSVIQHGPHPAGQAYFHDLPLAAVLAYIAADCAGDLRGRRSRGWWWLVPTAAMVPLVALGPLASTLGQVALAAAAVGLGLARAWRRPELRRPLAGALLLLSAGVMVGNLGDRTGLCQPESLIQGHAIWHLLAAAALGWLAPAIGAVRDRQPPRAPEPVGAVADPVG